MAFISTFICRTCHQQVQEAVGAGQIRNQCRACENKELDNKRATILKGLEALTLEERIARLEAWAYDYKPPININDVRF